MQQTTESGSRRKLIIAGVLLAAAIGVTVWNLQPEDMDVNYDALAGLTYNLKCSACNQMSQMSAVDYTRQLADLDTGEGVKCASCGANKAWQWTMDVGQVDESMFAEEDLTTLAGVEAAKKNLGLVRQDVADELIQARASNDEAKIKELEPRRDEIERQYRFLDEKWNELASKQ